jgi:hypothetical protein
MAGVRAAVDDKVHKLSGLQLNAGSSDGLRAIGGDGFCQQSPVRCEHFHAYAVPLIGIVSDNTVEQHPTVIVGGPATDGTVLQIVAGMSAIAAEKHPAELWIGELISALQPTFANDGERLKAGNAEGIFRE